MATFLSYFGLQTEVRAPTLSFSNRLQVVATTFGGCTVTTQSGPGWKETIQGLISENKWVIAGLGVLASCALPPRYGIILAAGSLSALACQKCPPLVRCPEVVEGIVAATLGMDECTTLGGAPVKVDEESREISSATRKWVQKVKLHFGEVRDTPAEQICVKKWLAEQMKSEDMRDKDARGLIPTVAFLATVPDDDDAAAVCARNSAIVRNMRVLGGHNPGK